MIENIINWGLIVTIVSFVIIYFGRIALKSKKELTKDSISEILEGVLFLGGQPLFIVSVILFSIFGIVIWNSFLEYDILKKVFLIISVTFFAIQPFIFKYYAKRFYDKKFKIPKSLNELCISISIIAPSLLLINKIYFLILPSIVYSFFTLTYICSSFNMTRKKVLIELDSQKKTIEAYISRIGEEFIDIINKEGKEISLNKSKIIKIEKIK